MDACSSFTTDRDSLTQVEAEQLPAEVAGAEAATVLLNPDGSKPSPVKESLCPFDFRHKALSSAPELRKLRVQHKRFIDSLAARLSSHLRLEFGLRLSSLETLTFHEFTGALHNPTHLSLIRIEPLPGLSVFETSSRLGLTLVDRLAGGPGHTPNQARDLSEIELALLAHVVQLIMGEWCAQWTSRGDLRPVLLGHETHPGFLQISSPDTVMLVLAMEARIGDCVETIRIAAPDTLLKPLIEPIVSKLNDSAKQTLPHQGLPPIWRRDFGDVKLQGTAEWAGVQVTARELGQLKVGDVLTLRREYAEEVQLHLAGQAKFRGRLGVVGKKRAVELIEPLKK
jgi:flagellar motor switch protein FliM